MTILLPRIQNTPVDRAYKYVCTYVLCRERLLDSFDCSQIKQFSLVCRLVTSHSALLPSFVADKPFLKKHKDTFFQPEA